LDWVNNGGLTALQVINNLKHVEEKMQAACLRAGRKREEIQIIAVTKYASLARTIETLESGLHILGESRWQDTAPKWERIQNQAIWHFIGHLQTNKVKDILGKFSLIHSLDRQSLAEEIEKKAAQRNIIVDCLIQVNVSGEESKHGMQPESFAPFMQRLEEMPHIRPVGLMTMAPFEDNPERTRTVFKGLKALRDRWNEEHPDRILTELSMGMSNDFEIAIEEGATMIRLGTILIGEE
jgi:pyridoxal phosphate enzyme (YggS family)